VIVQEALFGNGATDRVDRLLLELWKTEGWPRDEERDRALIGELVDQFPSLDLEDEFSKFRVWLLSQTDDYKKKRVKSRGRWSTLRNWCRNAVRGGRRSGVTAEAASGAQRRTSTAARPPESFKGDGSLSGW
jgi:hypothetical protein